MHDPTGRLQHDSQTIDGLFTRQVRWETETELRFLDRLRDEIKFPTVEALKGRSGGDVRKAQTYLRRLGRAELVL